MTAKIYQFADYQKKIEKPKKRRIREKNFVIFNENLDSFFQEEQSVGLFVWTPNLIECLRVTEPAAKLMLARLKWYYSDHELGIFDITKASKWEKIE